MVSVAQTTQSRIMESLQKNELKKNCITPSFVWHENPVRMRSLRVKILSHVGEYA